ncbi:hypothetical protein A1O3_01648 [Capronia epimyces CBS 606.96]|uniref:Uncharacterized protein n=1 Tax=Capronia epimyces CBS 606.96 TaxID=1182542 RepID=W9YJK4_9EURO|nr:uncharacterized protein A1O3_01648 [Capronia epimyces CBS 606.96]EXJ93092.1 hypothetical protein A1O3_01648 [Capronia epimyces CBS 606.96]
MFAVPGAKRIKRSELFEAGDSPPGSQADSRSGSPASPGCRDSDGVVAVPNYGFDYDFISHEVQVEAGLPEASNHAENGEGDQEQEYQFRLFTAATSRPKAQTSQLQSPTSLRPTIRLSRSPSPSALDRAPGLDTAHFVRPYRPQTYYFTSALPQETIQTLRSQYVEVAVSTSEVLSRAKSASWPGSTLPWRVIHVELSNSPPSADQTAQSRSSAFVKAHDASSSRSKSKPSKKRRIVLRRRLVKHNELVAEAMDAEMAEREKRTRRNREKKVKRKEREKRKKLLEGQPQADDGLHNVPKGSNQGEEMHEGKEDAEMTDVQTGQSPSVAPKRQAPTAKGRAPTSAHTL